MKHKNISALENLSLYSNVSGVITVFLGIMVILLDLSNKNFAHIQIGFFILITGYSFIKISAKISKVIYEEKKLGL